MIQLPAPAELRQLKNVTRPFCLTIYAPCTEGKSGAVNPTEIEIKNLLNQAQTALAADGADTQRVKKTLRPARALLAAQEFWPLQRESLVFFMHPDLFKYYRLPESVPYMLTVGPRFNLEPLENLMRRNRSYLLLALSHKNVKMYQGDRFYIRQLRLRNFPADMEASLQIDEYPKSWETHTVAPAAAKDSEAFHGQYNVNQTDKQMLFLFFRKIDAALHKFLQKKDMPLILAGVEYLLPIYHAANTSPYLVAQAIRGNVEHERPDRLRRRAWSLLKREGFV